MTTYIEPTISKWTSGFNNGKWIELEDFDCSDRGEYLVKCSICGSCNGYNKSKYCPNCSTEMRSAENDTKNKL